MERENGELRFFVTMSIALIFLGFGIGALIFNNPPAKFNIIADCNTELYNKSDYPQVCRDYSGCVFDCYSSKHNFERVTYHSFEPKFKDSTTPSFSMTDCLSKCEDKKVYRGG